GSRGGGGLSDSAIQTRDIVERREVALEARIPHTTAARQAAHANALARLRWLDLEGDPPLAWTWASARLGAVADDRQAQVHVVLAIEALDHIADEHRALVDGDAQGSSRGARLGRAGQQQDAGDQAGARGQHGDVTPCANASVTADMRSSPLLAARGAIHRGPRERSDQAAMRPLRLRAERSRGSTRGCTRARPR